jgi:GT2 family glycosyltransferase
LRPRVNFVLLGGVFDVDLGTLQALSNVRLLGQQPYETMPQYLHHFDACLIPFKINAITEATDPVKLYEYFTAGKPVIATAMPELAPYHGLVAIAKDRDEFVAHIDSALSENDPALVERRKATAREHTWEARWRSVSAALERAMPRASIVIVTHNQWPLTRLCLDSIIRNTQRTSVEVIVVDNASTDGTAAHLEDFSRRHRHVSVILNETNRGFAAANNQGLERASGEYLILLNNDTIVPPGWLTRLLRHLDDPRVGLVGPTTNFVGNEAQVEARYETILEMEHYAHERARRFADQVADIHMLAMFCVAIRRNTLRAVGPLDERFGIGMFEDDDYSMRVKNAGLEVVCALDAFIHHFGQSSFVRLIEDGTYNPLFNRNRRLYEQKWNVTWTPHVHAPLVARTHLPAIQQRLARAA